MDEIKKTARVIDFHSHVLPCIDDGSSSLEMSLEMLRTTYSLKIRKLVATPHFYPSYMSLESFLENRTSAIEKLLPYYNRDEMPLLYVGAEVAYHPDICKSRSAKRLCIEGTNTLLFEMPFSKWTDEDIENIIEMKTTLDINVVIAHIERYMAFQKKDTIPLLLNEGIHIQSNAEFFVSNRREAIKLLEKGYIQILGSDMHNTTTRSQNLDKAKDEIKKRLGEDYIRTILLNTKTLLEGAVSIDAERSRYPSPHYL